MIDLSSASTIAALALILSGFGGAITWLWLKQREIVDDAKKERDSVRKELDKCKEDHAIGMADNAALKETVRFLERDVRVLQGGAVPGLAPVIITAGLDGLIMDASPSCSPMLHWLPRELVGKSIETLIPDRYLPAHRKAFGSIVGRGNAADVEPRAVVGFARRRDGQEIPVVVLPSWWQDETEKWMVTAEISHRKERPRKIDGGNPAG